MPDATDAAGIAEQAYTQAEREHEINCQVMDDHQTHVERALSLMIPTKMADTMTRIVENYFTRAGSVPWNRTHHASSGGSAGETPAASTGDNLDASPSSRGESPYARRLLGPLAAAAAGGGIALAANHFLSPRPDPVDVGPGSTYQYLEDQGYHVPPATPDG